MASGSSGGGTYWSDLKRRLAASLAAQIRARLGVEHEPVVEVPPRRELGDLAFPAALHLARELKRKPCEIAAELLPAIALGDGVRDVRIEGAGYLNVFLDRAPAAAALLAQPLFPEP